MKKILTLLIAVGAITAAQAQSREDARRVILGDGNNYPTAKDRDVVYGGRNNYPAYPNTYPSANNRQYQVDQVNREYDAKIQSIRANGYLSWKEKQRSIEQLERDRQRRIQQINAQYNSNGGYNSSNDHCDNDNNGWNKNKKRRKGW